MGEWTLMLNSQPVLRFLIKEGRSMVIGRAQEADLVLDNPAISRMHAAVELDKGVHYITDLGSANGTSVNGKRIGERTKITPRDMIMIGKFRMVYGAVGLLDMTEKSQSVGMGADPGTIFVPMKKK